MCDFCVFAHLPAYDVTVVPIVDIAAGMIVRDCRGNAIET